MKKIKVAFCGTPDFAVPALDMLKNHPAIELVAVVTMPDRPAGRGQKLMSPPVAEYAKANKIKLIQTENINKSESDLNFLEDQNLDCFVVLAFAQFLGSKILNMPKLGCFNIHTSILPKYRGAAPIQYALLNGDKETGVSIQKMVKKMDAGDLVVSDPVNIFPYENGGQLYTRLKYQAALSLNKLVDNILNNEVTYTLQNEDEVSFAPTLKKEDGLLNFKESNFEKINNQIRALDPWPGTFCFMGKKRLKVFSIEKFHKKLSPGETIISDNCLLVGCLDTTIRITELQLEGKKRCLDTQLLNGIQDKESINLNPEL